MNKEIERKFLVSSDEWRYVKSKQKHIVQTYLASSETCHTRVRITNEKKAEFCLKSKTKGISRDEFEWKISLEEGKKLLKLAITGILIKTRYVIKEATDGMIWEIDEYNNKQLNGIIVAEIELKSERQSFYKPPYIGKEVTGIRCYGNWYLASLVK
jgi:adenylate cyclase